MEKYASDEASAVTPFMKAADNERLIYVYCHHIYPNQTVAKSEREMYRLEFKRRGINIEREIELRVTPEAQRKVYEELQIFGFQGLVEKYKKHAAQCCTDTKKNLFASELQVPNMI